MDLGIRGRRAIVCAASKGLGRGCAEALAREGVNVVITARGADALDETAAALRALAPPGTEIRTAPGDITTDEGRAAALAACPQVDILVTNAGGPPPGDFFDVTDADWERAFQQNLMSVVRLVRACVPLMERSGGGTIVSPTMLSVSSSSVRMKMR